MESARVGSLKDLKSKRGDEWCDKNIFDVNKKEANRFAASIREDQKGGSPVITPAPLEVGGWEQAEYLAFWEELIRTRVTAVHFKDKWEYSNGCTFEYAVALDAKIGRFDEHGQPLERDRAISYVRDAIDAIAKMEGNFDTAKLNKHLEWIETVDGPIVTTTKISGPIPVPKVNV